MAFDVFGAALADGQRSVFSFELSSGILEEMAALQFTRAVFELEREVPILCNSLGVLEVSFLRAGAMIATGEIHRTLPIRAVLASIDMELIANDYVVFGHVKNVC